MCVTSDFSLIDDNANLSDSLEIFELIAGVLQITFKCFGKLIIIVNGFVTSLCGQH